MIVVIPNIPVRKYNIIFKRPITYSGFAPFMMDCGAVFDRSKENSLACTLRLIQASDVSEASLMFLDFWTPLAIYTLSLLLFMSPRTPTSCQTHAVNKRISC